MHDDQLFPHSHHVPRTERSRCWTFSWVSVCTSNRTQQPGNHGNQGVTRSYQKCNSLNLRDKMMTIVINIIIIIITTTTTTTTEIYIVTNRVVHASFNSDPFWWKMVLNKSCRHVAKFKHPYAKSTRVHSWSLIKLPAQNCHVIHLKRPTI